jgi:hypothetical protein
VVGPPSGVSSPNALHGRLIERELLFPEVPFAKRLGQAGLEKIDRLDDVRVAGHDKLFEHRAYQSGSRRNADGAWITDVAVASAGWAP